MTDDSKPIQGLIPASPMPASPNGVPSDPLTPLPALPTFSPESPNESPARRVTSWRFLAAMLFQSALIVAVPFQSALTYAQGETITLQTAPVDPYDLLRGYSQTLNFDISNPSVLKPLPGGTDVFNWKNEGELVYVTLIPPTTDVDLTLSILPAPDAWKPVAVSLELPENLDPNQVALQGRYQRGRIVYGLETYYMPEAQRHDINNHIRQVQQEDAEAFVVDVKVDAKGNSVPLSLWVKDRAYQF